MSAIKFHKTKAGEKIVLRPTAGKYNGKRCSKCEGYASNCYHNPSVYEYQKLYRLTHRKQRFASQKNSRLRKTYGINLTQYEKIVKRQSGICLICKETPRSVLAVDHNHSTGKIRGLLCLQCNTKLGWFEKHAQSILKYAKN